MMTLTCSCAILLPQHCLVPAPKPSCGPAIASNPMLPSFPTESQRSGSNSLRSLLSSHEPWLFAYLEVGLRRASSTGNDGDKKPGPPFTMNTWQPLGMRWPRISVSLVASRTIENGVRRCISAMTASRYGSFAHLISSNVGDRC